MSTSVLVGEPVVVCEHGLTLKQTADGMAWEFLHGLHRGNPEARRVFHLLELAEEGALSAVRQWLDEVHAYEAGRWLATAEAIETPPGYVLGLDMELHRERVDD